MKLDSFKKHKLVKANGILIVNVSFLVDEQILEVCREFEVGPMLAIGMKNSCKL